MFGGAGARAAARKAAAKKTAKAPPKPAQENSNSNNGGNNGNNGNNSSSNNNSPPPPKKTGTKPAPAPKPSAAASTAPRRSIVPLPTPAPLGEEYSDAALQQAERQMKDAKAAAEAGNASTKGALLDVYMSRLGKYENIVAVREKRQEKLAYGVALQALVRLDVEKGTGNFKGFKEGMVPKKLMTKMEVFDTDANGNALYRPIGWADAPTEEQIRQWEAEVRSASAAADAKYPEAAGMQRPPPDVNVSPEQWAALSKEDRQSIWGAHTVGKAKDAGNPGEPTWKGLAIQLTGQVVSGAVSLGSAYAGHYIEGTGRFAAPAIQSVAARAAATVVKGAAGGYRTKRSVRRSTKTRRSRK
jgi:hypothetical protein